MPTHVAIEAGDIGLPQNSVALIEQMRVINKDTVFGEKVASLTPYYMRKISVAVKVQCPFFAS